MSDIKDNNNNDLQSRAAKKAAGFFHDAATVKGIKERLNAYNIRPNKALGQNFLADEKAIAAMANVIPAGANVYEIGPGLGALTGGLLHTNRNVLAVEKDKNMADILRASFINQNITILHADALTVDEAEIKSHFKGQGFWVAANLPYYITTPIMIKLLRSGLPIDGMVIMAQKEGAARFFAQPGEKNYGPLSVLMQLLFYTEVLMHLSPSSFYPSPSVFSTVIKAQKTGRALKGEFADFLKGVMAMRRKTISNNLLNMGVKKELLIKALNTRQIKGDTRAEALSPQELLKLYNELSTLIEPC